MKNFGMDPAFRDPSGDLPSVRWGPLPAIAGTAVLLLGICGGPSTQPTLAPVAREARLYYDDASGITDSLRLAIRSQQEWREVWDRATSRRANPPAIPAVDFDQSVVLVVAAGRSSPGDRIRVDSAGVRTRSTTGGESEEVLAVIVRTVRGCGTFQADAYPVEIVRVEKFDGPVEFVERSGRASGCEGGAGTAPAARADGSNDAAPALQTVDPRTP